MRCIRLRNAPVAERPEQAGGGDVGEVAGDRCLLVAVVGETVGDLVGDALGEQVAEPLGAGDRVEVEADVSARVDAERREQASDVTISGRIAASSAAIIPPTEAPTT